MRWQYTDNSNRNVLRINPDGSCEARSVEGADFMEWLASGNVPDPYVEPPPVIPAVVSMRQARRALLDAGHLPAINAIIKSLPSPQKEQAQIDWEFGQEVNRNYGLVVSLIPALGLTDAQVDQLFITAAGL